MTPDRRIGNYKSRDSEGIEEEDGDVSREMAAVPHSDTFLLKTVKFTKIKRSRFIVSYLPEGFLDFDANLPLPSTTLLPSASYMS